MAIEHQRAIAKGLRALAGRIERGEIALASVDSGQHSVTLHFAEPGVAGEMISWLTGYSAVEANTNGA